MKNTDALPLLPVTLLILMALSPVAGTAWGSSLDAFQAELERGGGSPGGAQCMVVMIGFLGLIGIHQSPGCFVRPPDPCIVRVDAFIMGPAAAAGATIVARASCGDFAVVASSTVPPGGGGGEHNSAGFTPKGSPPSPCTIVTTPDPLPNVDGITAFASCIFGS